MAKLSLKIRIPFCNVQILNDVLGDEYYVFSKRTGEEITDENFKRNAYFHESKGCKTYYKIEQQIGKDGAVLPYLTILLTSKILGIDYFKGIQRSTVLQAYEQLMSQQVIYVTFEDFMFGECTDTDIKVDLIPRVEAVKVIDTIYSLAKPKKLAIEAASLYRRKDNLGVQFALRKTSRYINCPYLKFYEKVRELKYKSKDFYFNQLQSVDLPKEILRIETTIKNKKHFKHFRQRSTTLAHIIDNLDDIATLAFKKAFEAHLDFSEKSLSGRYLLDKADCVEDLRMDDKIIHYAVVKNMEMGLSFKKSKEAVVLSCAFNKSERYKLRKRMERIFKKVGTPYIGKGKISLATYNHVMSLISSDNVMEHVRA